MGHLDILAAAIVLFASFIRSVSGFGYALISTPLLTFLYDAKSVVVMNSLVSAFSNLLVLYHTRKSIDGRRAVILLIGSALGTPIGVVLLSYLHPSVIKLAIAALVIPFSIVLMLGYSFKLKRDLLACSFAGFLSGIFGSATSLGGPVVALFLLNQGMTRERFVGTMAVYFTGMKVFSIGAYVSMGLINTSILLRVGILLPSLMIGSYFGVRLIKKINVTLFRWITTSVLVGSALAIIVSFLVKL